MSDTELADLIVDPAAYAEWDQLQHAFARARRETPVACIEAEGFDRFWAITRADDIREVERRADVFKQNGIRAGLHSQVAYQEALRLPPNRSLTALDAPDHMKLRGVTAKWFSPARIKKLEGDLRPLAQTAVRRMLATGGACDFSKSVAVRYPLSVILSILGVPPEEEDTVLALTQRVFRSGKSASGKRGSPTNNEAVAEFRAYFDRLTQARRADPRDDVASVIASALVDGELLPDEAVTGYYITISTAGHDTTSSSLAGAIWGLCENPDQYAALRARPELIRHVADEAVRWSTPVQHFMRTAASDVEINGHSYRAGDWVMLCYPSGNRDEAHFDNAHRFDLSRSNRNHVGFGYGPHMCLGMHLAKLEIELFFDEMVKQVSRIELTGSPTRAASFFVGGPNYVPIAFEA